MSSTIRNLKKQIAEAQARLEAETNKLQAERAKLVARLAEIDAELGGGEAAPAKVRARGVNVAVTAFIAQHPGSTIKEVQAGLPELPASSVETNIRAMAAKGALMKDDSTPRKFSVPTPEPTPAAPAPTKANGSPNGVNSRRAATI